MNKYLLFLISIMASYNIAAQCPSGSVFFFSQTNVNQFIIDYPDCTVINGDINIFQGVTDLLAFKNIKTVEGELKIIGNDDLSSLTGLDSISLIGGDLNISSCENLTSLNGLNNLINIGASLRIHNNPSLTNLSALSNLASVDKNLSIQENDELINLIGLDQITTLSGFLNIADNENLTSLTGLENIDSVGNYLDISSNSALTNLNGLESLEYVQNHFGVGDNIALTSLSGVENLAFVGDIGIAFNPVLQSLESLANLTSIETIFYIGYNEELNNLKGLENIDPTTISCIKIYGNSSLSMCEINSICSALPMLSDSLISIATNAPGCNNQSEIEDACTLSSTHLLGKKEISLYPNPTYDLLQTSAKIGTSYFVVDRLGMTRRHSTISTNKQIDLSDMEPGVYFIQFENGGMEKVVKL